MENKTLYALGALVALSLLTVLALRSPEKGERVGERPRPVAKIPAGSIAALEISQPGGKDPVTLTKKGDKWQVTAPYDKPADPGAVKSVVEALEVRPGKKDDKGHEGAEEETLRWGDISTTQKERHGELEVSDDKAIHLVAKDGGGKALADLYIGKAAGSSTMVRVAGKDDVWQAAGLPSYAFRKAAKEWRDHVIFDQKADEAEKVVLVGGGTQVTLQRKEPDKGADGKPGPTDINSAKWKILDEGQGAFVKAADVPTVDDAMVNGVVQGLANLRAGDFLDTAKPEELGLQQGAPGQIEARVSFKGGKTIGVRIGLLKGDDYHAQVLDGAQVFTAKKYSLERVAHLPQDLKDKTLVKLKEDDLSEISIAQGTDTLTLKKVDKAWKADKVDGADDAKVKPVAESFDNLVGSGFIAPGAPAAAGLAKPKATVTLKPKTGAAVTLKIGEAQGEDVPVQKVGMDPVWVRKYQVDRFLKKPADLKK